MRGEVELYYRQTSKQFKILKVAFIFINLIFFQTGDHFGEYSLFSGQNREMSARSSQVTQLAYLSQSDFLETLKEFSIDYVYL